MLWDTCCWHDFLALLRSLGTAGCTHASAARTPMATYLLCWSLQESQPQRSCLHAQSGTISCYDEQTVAYRLCFVALSRVLCISAAIVMQLHCPATWKHGMQGLSTVTCHAQSSYMNGLSVAGATEVVRCLTPRTGTTAAAVNSRTSVHKNYCYCCCHTLPMRMSRSRDSMPSPLSMKWYGASTCVPVCAARRNSHC